MVFDLADCCAGRLVKGKINKCGHGVWVGTVVKISK